MKFEPKVEKIDGATYVVVETATGKNIMDYDESLTIKEHFYNQYENTNDWEKLKVLVDKIAE